MPWHSSEHGLMQCVKSLTSIRTRFLAKATNQFIPTKSEFDMEEAIYKAAALIQQSDKIVALIDPRMVFKPYEAEKHGCDLKSLLVSQPGWRQSGDVAKMLADSANVAAILVLSN
jgi:hypothetical protein